MSNGKCQQRLNRCDWSVHVNVQFRLETERIEEKHSSDINFYCQKTNVEAKIKELRNQYDDSLNIVLAFVAEIQRGLQRLTKIAQKKDPVQQVVYLIAFLFGREESKAKMVSTIV